MFLLQQEDQNWTQYFTYGLTSAKSFPSAAQEAAGLLHHKYRLLAHGQLVHQDNQILFWKAAF